MRITENDFRLIGRSGDPDPRRGALILAEDAEGRILMQLRDDRPGVASPGTWGFFGGGCEDGEDLLDAACREWREETGLPIERGALTPFVWVQAPPPRNTRLFVFTARLDLSPADITLAEGAGFALMTHSQALSCDMPPFLRPVLVDYLSARGEK